MIKRQAKTKIILKTTRFTLNMLLNIIFYVLVILIIVKLSAAAYDFTYQIYGDYSVEQVPGTDVEFQINPGESTLQIAKKLDRTRIVVNKYSFFIRAMLSTSTTKSIMPGTYKLNTSMNYSEILEKLTDISAAEPKEDIDP